MPIQWLFGDASLKGNETNVAGLIRFGAPMGQGHFGKVLFAQFKTTGQEIALKRCNITDDPQQREIWLQKEYRNYKSIGVNECFVKLVAAFIDIDEHCLHICMEPYGKSLEELHDAKGRPSDKQLWQILYDVLKCLNSLHLQQIAHNDCHLGNFLANHSPKWFPLKLCDFGMIIQNANREQMRDDLMACGLMMIKLGFKPRNENERMEHEDDDEHWRQALMEEMEFNGFSWPMRRCIRWLLERNGPLSAPILINLIDKFVIQRSDEETAEEQQTEYCGCKPYKGAYCCAKHNGFFNRLANNNFNINDAAHGWDPRHAKSILLKISRHIFANVEEE